MNATAEPIHRCPNCGAWVYKNRACSACEVPKGRYDWMDLAACAGVPVEFFFPERGPNHRSARDAEYQNETTAALRICAKCPVRAECLDYGLEDDYGIFGGLLPHQRKLLRTRTQPRKGFLR